MTAFPPLSSITRYVCPTLFLALFPPLFFCIFTPLYFLHTILYTLLPGHLLWSFNQKTTFLYFFVNSHLKLLLSYIHLSFLPSFLPIFISSFFSPSFLYSFIIPSCFFLQNVLTLIVACLLSISIQRPYMTLGTLRDQVIYPHTQADQARKGVSDKDLEEFLKQVRLVLFIDLLIL